MSSADLVLITGATGFIGSRVVQSCLAAGYRVRLTVRKTDQIQPLKDLFPVASDLQFFVVPDFTKEDAFREAINGVDFVFHLSSPMPGKGSDLQSDYVKPAVQGTLSILNAAKAEQKVSKVVVMSSILALLPLDFRNVTSVRANTGEKIPVDLEMAFPDGPAGTVLKYQVSKILAHQATRDWLKSEKPGFVLVTVHPSFVIGPSLIQKTAEDIGGINSRFWRSLHCDKPLYPPLNVDVRDVASAFIQAARVPMETGTEFIMVGPDFGWGQIVELVKREYPVVDVKLVPADDGVLDIDLSSTTQVLGIKWTPMEDTIRSIVEQQLSFQRGTSTGGDSMYANG